MNTEQTSENPYPPGEATEDLTIVHRHGLARESHPGNADSAPPKSPLPSFPGYQILQEIGRGGMGVVYEAHDTRLNRIVALKMVLAGAHASSSDLVRFLAEAEAGAQLQHPNLVQIFEFGQHAGLPYFTMEYVSGGSLGAYAKDPLPPTEAARLGEQIARGVGHAHQHGIVHRDLKPENVLLSLGERHGVSPPVASDRRADAAPLADVVLKVTDFGLAKRISVNLALTATGTILGTPSYMAPEQATSTQPVGAAADVWALGAILYRMLTGRPPFLAASAVETIRLVTDAEPAPPSQLVPGVPRDLETICLKCLHKEPQKRYATGTDLADDLARFLTGQAILARPVRLRERVWMWGKRNKALAGALGAVALALAAGAAVSLAFAIQARRDADRADQEATRATESEAVATQQAAAARRATDQASRLLYVSNMRLANELWNRIDGPPRMLADLLAEHVPARPEDADYRDFTWRYAWTLLNRSARSVQLPSPPAFARVNAAGEVVTLDATGRIQVVDPESGRVVREYPPVALHPGGFDVATDGRVVARTGPTPSAIQFFDTTTGKEIAKVSGKDTCRAVALSPDGKFAASVWTDGKVRVHEVDTGKEKAVSLPVPVFRCLAVSPDGETVVLGNHPGVGKVTVYRVSSGERKEIQSSGNTMLAATFSRDGKRLALGAFQGRVSVWDTATWVPTYPWVQAVQGRTRRLALSPDGDHLLVTSTNGMVVECDLRMAGTFLPLKGHTTAVSVAAYFPDDKRLLTGDESGLLRTWDRGPTLPSQPLFGTRDGGYQLALDSTGNRLAAVGLGEGAWLWDRPTRALVRQFVHDRPHARGGGLAAPSIALAGDGALLAVGHPSSHVSVWDTMTGERVWLTPEIPLARYGPPSAAMPMDSPGFKRGVGALAFSPDGKFLAAGFGGRNGVIGNYDQVVKVWDVRTRTEVATLRVGNTVAKVQFSPAGTGLFAASQDGVVREWRVEGWSLANEWKFLVGVSALDLSGDGRSLAAGLNDGALVVHDLSTGQEIRRPAAHVARIGCVAFSSDGRTLATSGIADRSVKLWDAVSLRETWTSRLHGQPNWLGFAPRGEALLAAFGDGIRVFAAAPLDEIDRVGGLGRPLARPRGR